ncbi:Potassium voltage-gated channel subfamily H member 6 (Ether-a-go-go-related gene potassium channel 2) (ERG-2) (Eag-related protein 2) (Ether-a-go-go-related protein 2) (Voltage-gated potassium channel subunit Kv11.2) [Durusdinium trenchii]|uniref:Uncharacterized protein n=1 Tax=Durusdinium trenchii TaxID=1381693 RepID=A0ABP0I436_9DINO
MSIAPVSEGMRSRQGSPSIDESSPAEVWNVKEEKEAVEAPEESRPRSLATRMSTFNFSIIRATKTTRSKPSENKKKPRSSGYVINPQSNYYAYWQLLTTIALVFVVIVVPYQVGLLELQWDPLMMISCAVDGIFVTDMVIQFFTMYPKTTARGIQWEDSLQKIARKYVTTWFPIDLITIIPFDIIELASGADHMGAFKGTKAIRALRLLKLMRILKNLKWLHKFEIAVSIPYQQFALVFWQAEWAKRSGWEGGVRFLFVLLIVCHWLACVWAMTLQLNDPLAEPPIPTWIEEVEAADAEDRTEPMRGLEAVDHGSGLYLTAFYFCSYTMTSVGYGDIFPRNIVERVVCTMIILTAGLCWAYVLGEVCAIVSDMNSETQATRRDRASEKTHRSLTWEMMNSQWMPMGTPFFCSLALRCFMVAAFASTCILFTVSILSALNIQLEPYGILHWKEDLLLDMAQSGPSVPGGLPLGEFRKDTPPGWIPGDPSYSLKLYMERVRMWYRTFEGPDEMVGPLIAGRLQGRAQTIAHSLRLVDPLGNYDVGDAALVRLSVEEVRDPMNQAIILQPAIPSGVQALMNALKEAFGDAEQVQATRSLETFFDLKRGRLSLQEFSVEWNLKLEEAVTHAGLQINNVAKTFLFFRASQLPAKHVEDIMLQIHGDMRRFDDARNLALRLAHRQNEPGHFYDARSTASQGTEIEELYGQDWTAEHDNASYLTEPWSWTESYWQDYTADDPWSEWWPESYYDEESENGNYDWAAADEWHEDYWQEDALPEEEPAGATSVQETEDYYKGKGKGSLGLGCTVCGSKWHSSSSCPMSKGSSHQHGSQGWQKGKSKGKGKKGGFRGGFKGGFKGKKKGFKGKGKGFRPWSSDYNKGKGKNYMVYAPVGEESPTKSIREARQLHHARFGIDLSGPSTSSSTEPLQRSPEKTILNFDISREEDFLGRHKEQHEEPVTETTTTQNSKKVLSFPVMIHHGITEPNVSTYHTVAGQKRRGLLVDPGAAAGLIGSETLRDLVDTCLRPAGLDKHMTWKERSTSVTGISGKGDSTLAEVTFEFHLDGSGNRASFSADVLGGDGSLCPALIGNPSLRAMNAALITQFFKNNDGLLVCHADTSTASKPTMIRVLLTDSGHYIIPLDDMRPVNTDEQKKAVLFLGQVQQQASQLWQDCNSFRYCFQTTSTPTGAEPERSEDRDEHDDPQPRQGPLQKEYLYVPQPRQGPLQKEDLYVPQPRQGPLQKEDLYAPQPRQGPLQGENLYAPRPHEQDPQQEGDITPSPKHSHRDHWQKNGDQWIRHHVRSRQALFSPQTSRFPTKLSYLTTGRGTFLFYEDGTTEELDDDWTDEHTAQKMMLKKWTGMTVFDMKNKEPPPTALSSQSTEEIYIADREDHMFLEDELQAYEEVHFPEHLPDHKKTYLRKFYKAVPEEFYSRLKAAPITPKNCLWWLDRAKKSKKRFHVWELCSGSARLSLLALLSGLTVCFPVDMRYGWDIGYGPHQALLRQVHDELDPECLMGSPNCRPWSVSANSRDPADTAREREEEKPALTELQKMFHKQHKRHKMFVLEQPWSSALWNELQLPGERQRLDQCQFGGEIGFNNEQAAIFKYAMAKILAESMEAFDQKEKEQDYIHWLRDPITLAWLRSTMAEHLAVAGVCAHLQPWTKPVPTPHLKAEEAFLRLMVRGNVEAWRLLPVEDLRELSHHQCHEPVDFDEDWLICIFGHYPSSSSSRNPAPPLPNTPMPRTPAASAAAPSTPMPRTPAASAAAPGTPAPQAVPVKQEPEEVIEPLTDEMPAPYEDEELQIIEGEEETSKNIKPLYDFRPYRGSFFSHCHSDNMEQICEQDMLDLQQMVEASDPCKLFTIGHVLKTSSNASHEWVKIPAEMQEKDIEYLNKARRVASFFSKKELHGIRFGRAVKQIYVPKYSKGVLISWPKNSKQYIMMEHNGDSHLTLKKVMHMVLEDICHLYLFYYTFYSEESPPAQITTRQPTTMDSTAEAMDMSESRKRDGPESRTIVLAPEKKKARYEYADDSGPSEQELLLKSLWWMTQRPQKIKYQSDGMWFNDQTLIMQYNRQHPWPSTRRQPKHFLFHFHGKTEEILYMDLRTTEVFRVDSDTDVLTEEQLAKHWQAFELSDFAELKQFVDEDAFFKLHISQITEEMVTQGYRIQQYDFTDSLKMTDIKDDKDEERSLTKEETTQYRSILGGLLWLTATRIDLIAEVCRLQTFVTQAKVKHLKMANAIVKRAQDKKYKDLGIIYRRLPPHAGWRLACVHDASSASQGRTYANEGILVLLTVDRLNLNTSLHDINGLHYDPELFGGGKAAEKEDVEEKEKDDTLYYMMAMIAVISVILWHLAWTGLKKMMKWCIKHAKDKESQCLEMHKTLCPFGKDIYLAQTGEVWHANKLCHVVNSKAFRKKMTDLNTMMWEQGLPYELRCRLRSFFLQNRHQALHVTRQRLRDSMSPQLQSEVCIALNLAWIRKVTFFSQFMELIEETEERGLDVDPFRMCIADISRELDCGAFAQGERFDNVQVLYILSKGLVALNSRVGTNGAVWGEDFVLSDKSLIRPVRGFALTYLEVLHLTRANFMKVIERRRFSCPQLGQIVRKFCVRLAARRGILQHAQQARGWWDRAREGAWGRRGP